MCDAFFHVTRPVRGVTGFALRMLRTTPGLCVGTTFLWLAVDGPSETFARRLLEHGILVAPGSFFGPAGEGYVRFALVPTQEECERAAKILERAL